MPSTPLKPRPDTAIQPRLDPAAETVDPSKQQGDESEFTPDQTTLDQEQPIERAVEDRFPPASPGKPK